MKINHMIIEAEEALSERFKIIENIALSNQQKVLEAFKKNRIALRHFCGTTGYGYGDEGRDTLNKLYADVFGCDDAIVSENLISCGSHSIKTALYGLLRPNDIMLSISGKPYDTMDETIFGIEGKDNGSLKDFGVKYEQIELINDNCFDFNKIEKKLSEISPKIIYIQRSRGYSLRNGININKIEEVCAFIRRFNKTAKIVVDNCYCEFVEEKEPTQVGANVAIGSLIKNPGAGLVSCGGYIVGDSDSIDSISTMLTSSSLKREVGCSERGYRLLYQGLFMAPHTVSQALKGSYLFAYVMGKLGYKVLPDYNTEISDIVRTIFFEEKQDLIDLCRIIQHNSPVDSYVTPEPYEMAGYESEVIMSAGCFVEGSSIELSCDSPLVKPYVLYIQGGLTYEHVKLVVNEFLNEKLK